MFLVKSLFCAHKHVASVFRVKAGGSNFVLKVDSFLPSRTESHKQRQNFSSYVIFKQPQFI